MKKKGFQFYGHKKTSYMIKIKQPDYEDFMNLDMMKRQQQLGNKKKKFQGK